MLSDLSFDFFKFLGSKIYFRDSHDNRNSCVLSMTNRFDSLWFHAIICCDNNHDDVRYFRTTRSDSGKEFVSRCVYKGDFLIIVCDLGSSYRLGDPSSFSTSNISFSNIIQKFCFPMIDMPHDRNDRRSRD